MSEPEDRWERLDDENVPGSDFARGYNRGYGAGLDAGVRLERSRAITAAAESGDQTPVRDPWYQPLRAIETRLARRTDTVDRRLAKLDEHLQALMDRVAEKEDECRQ